MARMLHARVGDGELPDANLYLLLALRRKVEPQPSWYRWKAVNSSFPTVSAAPRFDIFYDELGANANSNRPFFNFHGHYMLAPLAIVQLRVRRRASESIWFVLFRRCTSWRGLWSNKTTASESWRTSSRNNACAVHPTCPPRVAAICPPCADNGSPCRSL